MDKIKKYQRQIIEFITIFLLLEFAIFPCLTMANTLANIVGGIALLIIIVWIGIMFYNLIPNSESNIIDKEELKQASKPKTKRKPKTK